MLRDRASRGLLRVRLRVRNGGEAAADHSPMIKDARDMPHLLRLEQFDAAQSEIVILRAFESFPEPADLAQKIYPINAEMIDVILAEKKFRVPIGFEKRIRARAVLIDLVFVGINQTGVRMPLDLERDQRQRVFREGIVLIQQRAPFARRESERGVRAGGDVAVLCPED